MFGLRVALGLALAWLLAGCYGARVDTQVTPFHTIPSGAAGKSFIMVPSKEQTGSLEWAQYSNLVAQKLESKGLRPVRSESEADYAVALTYGIDQGRTTIQNNAYYGRTSVGTTTYSTSYVNGRYVPTTTTTPDTYGVVDSISSATTYGRTVKVTIMDVRQSVAQKTRILVYEATATSSGSDGSLNNVLPTIIEAMFKDWPGKSGATQQHSLDLKQ